MQIDEDNVLDETTGQSLVDSEELIDVIVVAGEDNDDLALVALISGKRDNFINGFFGQCTVFQFVCLVDEENLSESLLEGFPDKLDQSARHIMSEAKHCTTAIRP